MQYSLILSIGRTFVRINCYVCRRVIMKYLLCILSLAFLLVGVGLFSNEEDLQGFREETGVPVLVTSRLPDFLRHLRNIMISAY